MSNIIPFGSGAVPAYAQRAEGAPAMSAGLGGGGFNRIVLKMGVWRIEVGGKEVQQHQGALPVIIQGYAPTMSRQYYEGAYNPNDPPRQPDCVSANGQVPLASSPKPQSASCSTCPRNVKNQNGYKDCALKQRTVVSIYGDSQHRLFRLDVPAMSIFDKGNPQAGHYGYQDYAAKIDESRVDVTAFITSLVPDLNASVAKYFFSPTGYLAEDDYNALKAALDPAEVARYVGYGDAAGAQTATAPATGAATVSPVAVAAAPSHPATPEAVVQPVAAPVVQPVVQPVVTPVSEPVVQPVAQPVVQPVAVAQAVATQPDPVPAAQAILDGVVSPVAQAPAATAPTLASAEAILANMAG